MINERVVPKVNGVVSKLHYNNHEEHEGLEDRAAYPLFFLQVLDALHGKK